MAGPPKPRSTAYVQVIDFRRARPEELNFEAAVSVGFLPLTFLAACPQVLGGVLGWRPARLAGRAQAAR
jgi:hypothetical protein